MFSLFPCGFPPSPKNMLVGRLGSLNCPFVCECVFMVPYAGLVSHSGCISTLNPEYLGWTLDPPWSLARITYLRVECRTLKTQDLPLQPWQSASCHAWTGLSFSVQVNWSVIILWYNDRYIYTGVMTRCLPNELWHLSLSFIQFS